MSTYLEERYEQFGKNTVTKCRATFLALLHDRTTDARLIAAAERGRRAALLEMEVPS